MFGRFDSWNRDINEPRYILSRAVDDCRWQSEPLWLVASARISEHDRKLRHTSNPLTIPIPLYPRFPPYFDDPYFFKIDQQVIALYTSEDTKGTVFQVIRLVPNQHHFAATFQLQNGSSWPAHAPRPVIFKVCLKSDHFFIDCIQLASVF